MCVCPLVGIGRRAGGTTILLLANPPKAAIILPNHRTDETPSVAKLGKPPVVEVWLAIEIEPSPDGPRWGLPLAHDFLSAYRNEYTRVDIEGSRQYHVTHGEAGEPRIHADEDQIDRLKAFDPAGSRCIQVSRDAIIFNCLNAGVEYPGYDAVYQEAEEKFGRFLERFRPLGIRSTSLCYADVIEIAFDGRPSIDISDYFLIAKDFPTSPFGGMGRYSVEAAFSCPDDPGPMVLRLQSLPPQSGDDFVRFYMECKKQCTGFESLDLHVVKSRLQRSKDYIGKCFKASFTRSGWQLFKPVDDCEE